MLFSFKTLSNSCGTQVSSPNARLCSDSDSTTSRARRPFLSAFKGPKSLPPQLRGLKNMARGLKTIIFVRHGESEYNKAMRETGEDPYIRDAPLTARGHAQCAAAREELSRMRQAARKHPSRPKSR